MSGSRRVVISMDDQKLEVMEGTESVAAFDVSTSEKGMGFEEGSYRTPAGRFRICEKIGDGEPPGTIFKARQPVGVWRPGERCDEDLVLTRILRLDGIDPDNRNTLRRFIYIHGTNDEERIGRPAGHGCVRLRNLDMIALHDMMNAGDLVEILPPSEPVDSSASGASDQMIISLAVSGDSVMQCPVMSTKKKTARKKASTGVRYSDDLKKQVVEFVETYNSKNGRGGQSAAAKKFKVTPLTIATWLKAAGAKKPGRKTVKKAAKKAAAKTKKAAGRATKKGVRYSDEFKKQVVDFVNSYNESKGRGGQNQAAKKFKVSVLTVSSWLKSAGVKGPGRKSLAKKATKVARKAKKAAKKAKRGALNELESLKAAIRKLLD